MHRTSDNILSEILTKTTEYDPVTNPVAMRSLHARCGLKFAHQNSYIQQPIYYFCAGSAAELRIKTLLSCIGDVDIMHCMPKMIALPPQLQYLPSNRLEGMDTLLDLRTIVPLPDYPGYMHLHFDGFLKWNKYSEKYDIIRPREKRFILLNSQIIFQPNATVKGPAIHARTGHMQSKLNGQSFFFNMECDYVKCVRCPCWPDDAQDFIDRLKPSGWPPVSLIQEIRGVGCDVVAVAHPNCRPVDIVQWRFSFSKAEVALIRSWTKTQQIVYHLLRYFIKNTLEPDNEIISIYHLKTIMLWKCEQQDDTFWNESQLIGIVSRLISCLVQHLNSQRLQHYFIAEYNLFDSRKIRNSRVQCEQLTLRLIPFTTVERLVDWFLEYYLLAAYENIPQGEITRHTEDLRYITDLVKRAIYRYKRRERLEELRMKYLDSYKESAVWRNRLDFAFCVYILLAGILSKGLIHSHGMLQMYLRELPQVDVRLDWFFRGFWYLLLAQHLPNLNSVRICSQLISNTLDLSRVSNASDCAHLFRGFHEDSSESYFNKAIFLLRIQKKDTTEARLMLAFSKACFAKSLESNGELPMFYDATAAYLATMLYSEKQFPLAVDFCASVTAKIAGHQISNCCRVELQLLPECDDISVASGFSHLYEYIIRNVSLQTYDPHSSSNDPTPTLLIYFIRAKASKICQGDTTYSQMLRLVRPYYSFLAKSLPKALLSTCDFCLYGFMLSDLRRLKLCSSVTESHSWRDSNRKKQTIVYSRCEIKNIDLSDRYSLSNSTATKQCPSFEDFINRKHLIDMFIDMSLSQLTEEYRAMYHYRRGEINSALRICCEIMNVPSYNGVVCSRPFDLFLDDDLAPIIENKYHSIVVCMFYGFFLLYLKLRCLLDLQGPGSEIAKGIIELTLQQRSIVGLPVKGESRIEVDIVGIIRQRIRTLRTDFIIHGEERVSVKEGGSYTTYFIDPQRPGMIGTTKMAVTSFSDMVPE